MDDFKVENGCIVEAPVAWVEDPIKDQTVLERYQAYDTDVASRIEGQLVRKIDMRVLPFLPLIYICNYLDRNSITQAVVFGLEADTGLKGAVYNTAISIFFAGYILMQLPSTLIMTKVRPSLFLPGVMMVWAVVSGCTGATSSPGGVLAVRFFLGVVEAPFFPAAIYYLSCWYTKKELGIRMALLVSGILISNGFAGLISAGILQGMQGVGGLHSWRWLFIIEGLATFLVGAVAIFSLPDYPSTTRWLSEEEKIIAQARLAVAAGSEKLLEDDSSSIVQGVVLSLKDVRVWLFAVMQMANTAGISYSHFFPTIIEELHFTNTYTVLLLTAPPYAAGFIWSVSLCWHADRVQKRSLHASVSIAMAIVAAAVLVGLPDRYKWARYAFSIPLTCGIFGVYSTTYTWLSSTITQPRVKRAAAIGLSNTLSNIAALYASYFWLSKYAPTYQVSWAIVMAFDVLALACILGLRFMLKQSNRRFEELCTQISANDEAAVRQLQPDEQKAVTNGFRYVE